MAVVTGINQYIWGISNCLEAMELVGDDKQSSSGEKGGEWFIPAGTTRWEMVEEDLG